MMDQDNRWLLPEGIDQLLPDEAECVEALRSRILALLHSWGYRQVVTPLVEFLDSLLVGTGQDLDLQTFKLIDQLSGRQLGIRADITPQVARLDAKCSPSGEVARYCYFGTVLRARAERPALTRSPLQVGAELFGGTGTAGDLEVLRLMIETLSGTGLPDVHLDLGHVGIFRELVRYANLAPRAEQALFVTLQRKSTCELSDLLATLDLTEAIRHAIAKLVDLNGGHEVISAAAELLSPLGPSFASALAELSQIATDIAARYPELPLHLDLAELRGYRYHTGLVFAAFVPKLGRELARGGRYDGIGAAYGSARPATGFSLDLKLLSALLCHSEGPSEVIVAPAVDYDPTLELAIARLRAEGHVVLQQFSPGEPMPRRHGTSFRLEKQNGEWIPVRVDSPNDSNKL